ncbi:MAG TPA: RNA 2',3'-cyclic phosphodiesterase [Archaeoglobus profundus]|nr:RNA 2',3'-cyclic phosphodiesterase [Archaeoglobus profundus]
MRLFIAVDLSDELREKINEVCELVGKFKGVKPVEKENLHITLMFLGEVPDRRVEVIKEMLKTVKMEPFKLHLKGIGFFPSASQARVIWVGVEEGKDEISKLADLIESSMKKIGFKRDKDFVAHATIARVKSITAEDRRKLMKALEPWLEEDFGWMDVKEFKLKKSTLTPSGPIYEDLEIYKLS